MHRRMALLLALLCLALQLAACARLPERRVTPSTPAEATTIRLLVVGSDPHMDALIAAFYGKYPNQRVVKASIPPGATALDEARYRMEQGQVDVLSLPAGLEALVEQERLLAVDPYLRKSRMETAPLDALLEQFRWGGMLFDLPYVIDPYLLILNKYRLDEASLALPREGWAWGDFRAMAERLSQRPGETGIWGLAVPDRAQLFLTWLQQRTGEPFYRAGEKEVREMLQFAATMALTDRSTALAEETGGTTGLNILLEGQYGLVYGPMSTYSSIARSPNDRWAAVPLPLLPGAVPTGIVSYRSIGIAATSRNPDAAWEFVHFIAGPEGAEALARAGGIPAYRSQEAEEALSGRQPPPPDAIRALYGARLSIMPRGESTLDYRRAAAVNEALDQVLSGQRPWELAAEEFGQKLRGFGNP